MIGVDKVEDIRRRARAGQPVAAIARELGVSEPTVRKYRDMEDLSEGPRASRERQFPSLGGLTATIDSWLEEDRRCWRKQRHTAMRVYDRLREEMGYGGSYSTVRRYVRMRREEMARERDERDSAGYLLLSWLPGECQVDFGEADFRVRGVVRRGRYLTVSFPHSNVGLTQVFWGETSECVCQGLADAFAFVGGVPLRAVFDNATEVGRRVGGEVSTSDMFRRFAAHYGLDYSFTNPRSGNEKGNVENMVGTHRRNMFVPMPHFNDVRAFNRRLLEGCLALSDKPHYRAGTPQLELFAEDRAALSPLPPSPFACVRWERRARRCSKQGEVTLGGIHRYCAGPAMARSEVFVGLGAFEVTLVDASTGEVVATYEREWGDAPTSSSDPSLQLRLLCQRPGGWADSVVRQALPEGVVSYLDSEEDRADLAADLRALRDAAERSGFAAAAEGMSRALAATGGLDAATVALSAAVAASGDARTEYDEGVDLSAYDGALRLLEGGDADADEQRGA